jgi:hypothetical protein
MEGRNDKNSAYYASADIHLEDTAERAERGGNAEEIKRKHA